MEEKLLLHAKFDYLQEIFEVLLAEHSLNLGQFGVLLNARSDRLQTRNEDFLEHTLFRAVHLDEIAPKTY